MDSYDSKLAHTNTYWWITSLAISVVCCSVLFVVFASYLFQIKEDLAIAKVRFDLMETRMNEMSLDLQMLNHRSAVQQIQIVPAATGTAPAAATLEAAPPAAVAPPATPATPSPAPTPVPPAAPAKH